MQPPRLPLEQTTPVTEAIENGVDDAAHSIEDVGLQVQRTISIATTGGSYGNFVTQLSRLGLSVLRGYVSAWSTAIDGLGLIAADTVDRWWTRKLTPFPGGNVPRGVATASVTMIGQVEPVPPPWVRVVHRDDEGDVHLVDRGLGVPIDWDGTCFVTVRQFGAFIPGAAVVTVSVLDASTGQVVTGQPINAVLSLPGSA